MSTQIDLSCWEELEAQIRGMIDTNEGHRSAGHQHFSRLLFRGQANESWELAATLDRAKPKSPYLAEYFRAVGVAKMQIETYTGKSWETLDYPEIAEQLRDYDGLRFGSLPAYELLTYLRHHGFPSPLLDWSRSPYIAAFFAFSKPEADRVAIYVYREYCGEGKCDSSAAPQIFNCGEHVSTHPRHHLQQCQYTMALRFDGQAWCFAKHSDVVKSGESATQDRLWKFTVPRTESAKVMKRLHEYNITAYSLFPSEDSLMETLAWQTYGASA